MKSSVKINEQLYLFNLLRILIIILFLHPLIVSDGHLLAQNNSAQEAFPSSIIIPGPIPFSLDDRSAIYCINLLKDNRFLEIDKETGKTEIIEVHKVWSYFLGIDESYPEGHHLRYDIIVNGEPLNWDSSFIEYGGEMINFRLLFTYRNQYPPQALKYRQNP